MGDTVDALAYKTDVKARAKDNVQGKVEAMKVTSESVSGTSDGAPVRPPIRLKRPRGGIAQENPLGLAVGGRGVGFLAAC